MADIQYLNYGDLQIELLALLKNLADLVQGYVLKQPWSNKRKEKFMSAYSDIMNKGILGASNSTGQWMIDVGDAIDLDSKGKKDKEMYQEAAYFIQQQMAGMPTKSSQEEEEKKELDKFDFYKSFHLKLLEPYAGKAELFADQELGWDSQDKRGDNGLRPTKKRRATMQQALKDYLTDLEGKEYNFEGSNFKDKEDAKAKIQAAIDALDTETEEDDLPAFSALGLKYRNYFSNGGADINPTTGVSYLLEAQEALKKLDEETKTQAAKEAELAKANMGVLTYSYNNKAIDAIHNPQGYLNWILQKYNPQNGGANAFNNRLLELLEKSYNQGKGNGLSSQERKELGNMIHYVRTNNPKYLQYNLTSEDEGYLNAQDFKGLQGKRLSDFVRLPFLTSDGRYIYSDKSGNIYFLKPKNKQKLQAPTFVRSLAYNNYIKNFGKTQLQINNEQSAKNMNTPLSLMTEWSPEMKKEMLAIGWDIASIIYPEAFGGSAMALNAARLRGEANPNRSTLETILDYGTAGLGGILGFGDLLVTGKLGYRLYQLGKSMGSVSKFAGMLGAGFGAIGAFEARDSIAKLTNPSSLTPLDIENISYGFMGLIGLKSFAKARNKQTIGKQANPTTTEYNITVKDKNNKTHEIKIDEAAAKEILLVRTFGKKKETVDSEILNMPKIKESIQKYKEANPNKKLEIEGASIVNDSKSAFGISGKNKLVTENKVKNPNAPEYAPVGTKWYNPFGYMAQGNNKWGYYLGGGWQRKAWENAVPEHSSKGLWLRAKEFWNPEPKIKNETSTSKPSTETPNSTETPKVGSTNIELYNKNVLYEHNILNTSNKNNSRLLLKGDSLSAILADGNNYRFVYSNEGEAIVMLNGKPVVNPVKVKNLQEAKEIFSNFVKSVNSKLQGTNLGLFIKRFNSEYLNLIRELKRKGFFMKQGGKITDSQIDNFLKQYK